LAGKQFLAILRACLVAALGVALSASMAQAAPLSEPDCTLYAAPGGSESGPGTLERPYGSVQRMADRLRPGDVGCLRAGVFAEDVTMVRSGQEGRPIVLRSSPNEIATIVGRLVIDEGADFVTVAYLNLDGRNGGNLPSPTVNASDVRFLANNVTNGATAICFDLGSLRPVYRVSLELNRIHHCGSHPATNLQHGIYVEHATDVEIVGNLIHDNADRGVQLYPDAHRAHVASNVIDGNGEGVLIGGGQEPGGSWASSDNVIEHNMITFSRERYNVEAFWGSPATGLGNVVRRNCIFGGARERDNSGLAPEFGFSAQDNVFADPLYEDHDAGDFRLLGTSPCLDLEPAPAPDELVWVTPPATGPDASRVTQLVDVSGPPGVGVPVVSPKPIEARESTWQLRRAHRTRPNRRRRSRMRRELRAPARGHGRRARHEHPCPACGRAFAYW
jgi:hypothetical protein